MLQPNYSTLNDLKLMISVKKVFCLDFRRKIVKNTCTPFICMLYFFYKFKYDRRNL